MPVEGLGSLMTYSEHTEFAIVLIASPSPEVNESHKHLTQNKESCANSLLGLFFLRVHLLQ